MARNLREGFTLLELMVTVAVVAIIAAVAVPAAQGARKSAVEAEAVGMLRTIVTVQEQYKTRYGTYAVDLMELSSFAYYKENGKLKIKKPKKGTEPASAPEAQYDLKEFNTNYFANTDRWLLQLTPAEPGVTADRSFFVDNTGVIRVRSTGPARPTDSPID